MLELQGLGKQFGGLRAVDGVSFTVEPGSILGLIGPNGAGKTTLFNLVTGQIRATEGEVRFKGEPITSTPAHQIARRGLARTFQSTVLYGESTVLENVIRGCAVRSPVGFWEGLLGSQQAVAREEEARRRALEMLEFVELTHVKDELARNLPYGYQRALGVAIGLATGPDLLMMDEPVAGMNPEETAQMARLIQRLNQSKLTIVVVEHDMSFVMKLCHRIVVMNYGKKIAEGTPREIRANPDVISAYLGVDEDAEA